LTDHDEDIKILQNFAYMFFGQEITIIEHISSLWEFTESSSGIFVMHTHFLETQWTREYLERKSLIRLNRGEDIRIEEIIEQLISFGYTHTDHTGTPYTYKKEWSLLSITSRQSEKTIHIEWFDTEIESIIAVDQKTGTREHIKSTNLLFPHTKNIEFIQGESFNDELLSLIDTDTIHTILIWGEFHADLSKIEHLADIHFTDFHREESLSLGVSTIQIQQIDELLSYLKNNANICVYTKFVKTIQDFLEFHKIEGVTLEEVRTAGLESLSIPSSMIQESPLSIISDDILGKIFVKTRSKKSVAKNLELLLELKPGYHGGHRDHGIGKFVTILRKELSGIEREYIELHYAEWDKLFVPITEIYRVSKYLGSNNPELTRLSGKEWEKTIDKTTEEIEQIAQDILETNAKRSLAKGRAFGVFREEERIFQEAFKYEYTRDQRQAIEEIFEDMESDMPMDRLLSGDVGFGKTEVAMNAIYKAILSGTQVAVVSPLLVLADEHYETFVERFTSFGIRISIMTRMSSTREIEDSLSGLKNGSIDLVVGTHRLLSEDISFKKLGLLIIDEEHKFWVSHKERIKKIKSGVDILSLSATPIPRSLNLALSGVKKISLLTTPPASRKPIETIVSRWNDGIIIHAIQHELERGGQVLIIHNRILSMPQVEREILSVLEHTTDTDLRIITTHGQMPGEQIEERIHAFKKREYNILLTTTIIENGVNFLSANTIIILDPEEFGLASLHQLRGRVGRKDQAGYCYLIYRKHELVGDEKERLITIANNSHLGAGFEIAMRDMEIRGAGEVLWIKQSGKSKDIGLALYFRMLEEKINEIRSEKRQNIETKVELDLSYVLPESFFQSEEDKLNFYREIENIEELEELEDIEDDFYKHHATLSSNAKNLFLLLRARIILREYKVIKLSKVGMNYVFDFHTSVSPEKVRAFLDRFDRKKRMTLLSLTKTRVETREWKSTEDFLRELVGL
jgi:transcription-repair coupling factor